MERGDDDGGVVSRAFGTDARAGDRQHNRDAAIRPPLAVGGQLAGNQIRVAGDDDGIAVRVEQADGEQAAGIDESVGVVADQLVEHRLQPLLKHGAAKAQRPRDGAQGAGDFARTVAEIGLGGLDDTQMFLALPAGHDEPRAGEQAVNPFVLAWEFHFDFHFGGGAEKDNRLIFLRRRAFQKTIQQLLVDGIGDGRRLIKLGGGESVQLRR